MALHDEVVVVLVAIGSNDNEAFIGGITNKETGLISVPNERLSEQYDLDHAVHRLIKTYIENPHHVFVKQAGFFLDGDKLFLIYSAIMPTTNILSNGLEWVNAQKMCLMGFFEQTNKIVNLALKNGSRT
jgi:hypothetical protein